MHKKIVDTWGLYQVLLGVATPGRHPLCREGPHSATWQIHPFCKAFRRFPDPRDPLSCFETLPWIYPLGSPFVLSCLRCSPPPGYPRDTFQYRLKQGPLFDGKGTLFEALDYSLSSLRAMSL